MHNCSLGTASAHPSHRLLHPLHQTLRYRRHPACSCASWTMSLRLDPRHHRGDGSASSSFSRAVGRADGEYMRCDLSVDLRSYLVTLESQTHRHVEVEWLEWEGKMDKKLRSHPLSLVLHRPVRPPPVKHHLFMLLARKPHYMQPKSIRNARHTNTVAPFSLPIKPQSPYPWPDHPPSSATHPPSHPSSPRSPSTPSPPQRDVHSPTQQLLAPCR